MSNMFDSLPKPPQRDHAEYGEIERRPMGKIQAITAGVLHRNWVSIPHVTHNDEVDVTDLEVRRRLWNDSHPDKKLSPLLPVIKAVVVALRSNPQFNASLDDGAATIVLKRYFHIGIAVDTPNGLLVPVLRDCDKKSMAELAAELAAVSDQARTKGLAMSQMLGGCFTISSLGHIGGTSFSPIINAPEVAILGVTRVSKKATPGPDGTIAWREMLPVSLSYDHRLINGADAARFVVSIGKALNDTTFE